MSEIKFPYVVRIRNVVVIITEGKDFSENIVALYDFGCDFVVDSMNVISSRDAVALFEMLKKSGALRLSMKEAYEDEEE